MNLENRLRDIRIALKLADWFSTEDHIDYNVEFSTSPFTPCEETTLMICSFGQ